MNPEQAAGPSRLRRPSYTESQKQPINLNLISQGIQQAQADQEKLESQRHKWTMVKELMGYAGTATALIFPPAGGALSAVSDGIKIYQVNSDTTERHKKADNLQNKELAELHERLIDLLKTHCENEQLPVAFTDLNCPANTRFAAKTHPILIFFMGCIGLAALSKLVFGFTKQYADPDSQQSLTYFLAIPVFLAAIGTYALNQIADYNIQSRLKELARWANKLNLIIEYLDQYDEWSRLANVHLELSIKQEVAMKTGFSYSLLNQQPQLNAPVYYELKLNIAEAFAEKLLAELKATIYKNNHPAATPLLPLSNKLD